MKYLKIYEDYDFVNSDDDDVQYILTDYYHDNKCEIVKSNNFILYKFNNMDYYNEACVELLRHKLDYKSAVVRYVSDEFYIIINMSKEIIDYLDSELLSLTKLSNDMYDFYTDEPDCKYDRSTYTYYDKSHKIFNIDYELSDNIRKIFNISELFAKVILNWYVIKFIETSCFRVFVNYYIGKDY